MPVGEQTRNCPTIKDIEGRLLDVKYSVLNNIE